MLDALWGKLFSYRLDKSEQWSLFEIDLKKVCTGVQVLCTHGPWERTAKTHALFWMGGKNPGAAADLT